MCSGVSTSLRLPMFLFSLTDGPIAVGRMYINSISKLLRIGGVQNPSLVNPSLADLDCDSDLEDETSGKPLVKRETRHW